MCAVELCVNINSLLRFGGSHGYSQEEYDQMSLRTWVNVVCGKMTAIDRLFDVFFAKRERNY